MGLAINTSPMVIVRIKCATMYKALKKVFSKLKKC